MWQQGNGSGNQLSAARQSGKGPQGATETPGTMTEAWWQVMMTPSLMHVSLNCIGQHPQQQESGRSRTMLS